MSLILTGGEFYMNTASIYTPWLSVIVPIYNAEKHINKCIKSILSQSFTNFELLLIDDGSIDSTANICKKYEQQDTRVKYIYKENSGSYHTRYYGTTKAKGQYITFCDSDDYYAQKNAFQIIFEAISKHQVDMLQFSFKKKYNHLSQNVKLVDKDTLIPKDKFIQEEFPILLCNRWSSSRLTGYQWNKVYNRILFNNFPQPEKNIKIFFGDDVITNLNVLENCKSALYIPDTLYSYNQLSGGTKKFTHRHMLDLNNIKINQLNFLERWQGNPSDKAIIKKQIFTELAFWFFIHIKQGIAVLSEEDLNEFIQQCLQQESFILARKYYLEENNDNRDAIELLRHADPIRYINAAKASTPKIDLRSQLKAILKTIYKKI